MFGERRTVFQQALQARFFISVQRCADIGKMDVLGVNVTHRQVSVLKAGQQFVYTKCRQGGRTTQNFHHLISRQSAVRRFKGHNSRKRAVL